jgi:HK97 family phage prohead protease
MLIVTREDTVELEGYVNAVERNSKPLLSRMGKFIERICKGAFKKAIERNDDIHILLNHDWNKDLGSTKQGNLELSEDAIGLKARAVITDPEVVEKAKNGDLIGWSFGFSDVDVENTVENGLPTRAVKELDLYEVSVLDRQKVPAYEGNLITARSEEKDIQYRSEPLFTKVSLKSDIKKDSEPRKAKSSETEKILPQIDYSKYEKIINEMKGIKI